MWMLGDTESRTRLLKKIETVANSEFVLPLLAIFAIISVRKCERRETYVKERKSDENMAK